MIGAFWFSLFAHILLVFRLMMSFVIGIFTPDFRLAAPAGLRLHFSQSPAIGLPFSIPPSRYFGDFNSIADCGIRWHTNISFPSFTFAAFSPFHYRQLGYRFSAAMS